MKNIQHTMHRNRNHAVAACNNNCRTNEYGSIGTNGGKREASTRTIIFEKVESYTKKKSPASQQLYIIERRLLTNPKRYLGIFERSLNHTQFHNGRVNLNGDVVDLGGGVDDLLSGLRALPRDVAYFADQYRSFPFPKFWVEIFSCPVIGVQRKMIHTKKKQHPERKNIPACPHL